MRDLVIIFFMAMSILASVVCFVIAFCVRQPLYAVIGLSGLFSCAIVEVFLDMAKNIKAVREHLDLLMAMKKKEVIDKR